jgi:phytoene synthase
MAGAAPSWCADEVRRLDHDRYLTVLFAPKASRPALFGLYALNLEIARTREAVTEPMLGRIRLQWWRDRLGELHDGASAREHPVLQALAEPVRADLLPRAALAGMIDAREADLDDDPPADLAALEAYAVETAGTLAALAVRLTGAAGEGALAAAREVGTAWALIGLMRAVAFHAQARRLFLPDDLMRDFGIDRQALLDLKPAADLDRIVRTVIGRSETLLATARNRRDEVPKPARSPLLLATLADAHIADIARHGHDVFALPPATPPRPLRLLWAHWRGRY